MTVEAEKVEGWVSADEVAEHLSMTAHWVREMAKRGELPAVKFGAYWRFRISTVDQSMTERQQTPRTRR